MVLITSRRPLKILKLDGKNIALEEINSDGVKHLNDNFNHEFRWFVLSRALKNCLKWKILEAC